MNERFDEIVRQTRLYNQSVYDNGEGGWIVQTAELKKFAELIVRECMNLRNDPHIQPFLHDWKHLRDDNSHKEYATGWVEGTEVYRCGIRDYFGVKE
jgi:hypothetical protein